MISMLEKIARLDIKSCELQCEVMLHELQKNRDEFLSCEWIQDFEKKWMNMYVS